MVLAFAVGAGSLAANAQAPTDHHDWTPNVTQALTRGDAFFAKRQFKCALDSYRTAYNLSHHTCADCLLRIVRVERWIGDFTASLDDAKRAVKVAGDNKALAVQAHMVRGTLLAQMSAKPNDKKLKEAEEEFRAALALEPSAIDTQFNLGFILLRQARDAEGVAKLNSYVAQPGADPTLVQRAREMITNPSRAREPFAPEFSFKTREVTTISNAGLRGNVVLLDFWATWCPAARDSISMLAILHKRFAGRQVQLISISADSSESAWESFIAKSHIDWPEYIDLPGAVIEAFDVHEFPTFIVLDRDGVIRYRHIDFDHFTTGKLDSIIRKALGNPVTPLASTPAEASPSPGASGGNSPPSSL